MGRGVRIGGGRVVSCGQDKEVRVWDLASGRCEHVLSGHTDDVRGVSASSDGRLAATCSFDKTVRVWDLMTGQEVSTMEGHTDKVFGVAMAGDGSTVVSCSWDMSVRVWDVLSGEALGFVFLGPNPHNCLNLDDQL